MCSINMIFIRKVSKVSICKAHCRTSSALSVERLKLWMLMFWSRKFKRISASNVHAIH